MARSDLLLNLVRAANSGDRELLNRTVEAVISEERSKQHHVLADRLEQVLRQNGSVKAPSQGRLTSSSPAIIETSPSGRGLVDMVLSDTNRNLCRELVEEQQRADLLRSHGLEPRHTLLLAGPPGNGKTALADALAFELAVPLLSVRYDTLIASFLGETSSRLHAVFEYSRTRHCILFFDEFDTLGKERGDVHETGEIKRVVSSLLLQIDALPSYVIVVVATNHPELLDRAVWRRFQIRLEMPAPTAAQREEWFARAREAGLQIGLSPRTLASKFADGSYSDIEDFTLDLQRRLILDAPEADAGRIAQRLLSQRASMYRLKRSSR